MRTLGGQAYFILKMSRRAGSKLQPQKTKTQLVNKEENVWK